MIDIEELNHQIKFEMEAYKKQHMQLHETIRNTLLGRDVEILYPKEINGIPNRRGKIADTIFTYDIYVCVDIYSVDGVEGFLSDRCWFRLHNLRILS